MSKYWCGLVMAGCGRQSRLPGLHGKSESKLATGNWLANAIDAIGVARHFTERFQTLSASEVAPYTQLSSWLPTSGMAASVRGLVLPSTSATSRPSPTSGRIVGLLPSRKNLTIRAGWPLTILFFSRPYTPMPYSFVGPNSRVVITYESVQLPYFG